MDGNDNFLIRETSTDSYEMRVRRPMEFWTPPPQCPGGVGHKWPGSGTGPTFFQPALECDHPECICRDVHES